MKLKFTLEKAMKAQSGVDVPITLLFLQHRRHMVVGRQSHPTASLPPRKRDPIPIVQEAKWTLGSVWMDVENFKPTGVQLQNRPTPNMSLHRILEPAPRRKVNCFVFEDSLPVGYWTHSVLGTSNSTAVAVQGRKWRGGVGERGAGGPVFLYSCKTCKCILRAECVFLNV
jgi:hypothetical protein